MSGRGPRIVPADETAKVHPVELFFDLVFVFALTQVTALLASDMSRHGLLRGLLVLGLLWWAWVGYAWLGNVVRADEGMVRLVMFGAMAVMLVFALAIPEAFDDGPGGLPGPVVVAICYFLFRSLHLVLFWVISRADHGLRRQVIRFVPTVVLSSGLLLTAAAVDGPARTALWAAALLADYGGNFLGGASGWRLRSPGHFAERHGLILIVALGESIVAIGVGVGAVPITWPIVVAAVLGLVVSACLWWAYFDVVALVAERVLTNTPLANRARLARDSYSYLHLPMIAGVVLLALGLKKVLEYVADTEHHALTDPLAWFPLGALYGGVALYLLAHVAFRLRNVGSVNVQRLIVAAVLVALVPVAHQLPALAALGLLTALVVGLIGFEATHFASTRDRVRHHDEIDVSNLGTERSA